MWREGILNIPKINLNEKWRKKINEKAGKRTTKLIDMVEFIAANNKKISRVFSFRLV